jgi:hypothetical protein
MLKYNINPHTETAHFHLAINMFKNIQTVIFWVMILCIFKMIPTLRRIVLPSSSGSK